MGYGGLLGFFPPDICERNKYKYDYYPEVNMFDDVSPQRGVISMGAKHYWFRCLTYI